MILCQGHREPVALVHRTQGAEPQDSMGKEFVRAAVDIMFQKVALAIAIKHL